MVDHDVDHRHVTRALDVARYHVLASIFPPRPCDVRPRSLKMLRAAILLAWPDMDADEVALLMSVDDAAEYVHRDDAQFCIWYSADVVGRMANILNEDRVPLKPKREVKPVPEHLLSTPGLPKCGPKRERAVVVVRRTVAIRPPRPARVATRWDPPEARYQRPPAPQRAIPFHEPAYERSALYERRMAAGEVTA